MQQEEFTYILQNPAAITAAQTKDLSEIIEQFPFFQAAHAIRLKGLKNENSLHYNKALKTTATYTTDRSVLFDFITSEEFNQNKIANQIKNQERDPETNPEETAEEIKDFELEKELKQKIKEQQKDKFPEKVTEKSGKDPEVQLQPDDPLPFKKGENHSFSEWLKLTKAKPVDRNTEDTAQSEPQSRKFELIDEFISKSPKITPGKSSKKINLAEENSATPESLMTETLARVYLEQKNYKKAIQAYKILILKNPEKSGFFADQIRAIERIQEHN